MADFDPPFSDDVDSRRLPTLAERENGFPCGPADRTLFGGLFHRIESEIGEVISFAGLAPTDDRFTQLREAIQALIAAATGGGPTTDFLLVTQARARLPIFPEIFTAGAVMGVTTPGTGQVRVPGGVTFQHRGIFPIVTDQTDFATLASKTYHLRWTATGGFALRDLADVAYNPTAAVDGDIRFDSTYDDMLVARVITNSSNIPTITNLMNLNRMQLEIINDGAMTDPQTNDSIRTTSLSWNFARRPMVSIYPRSINTAPTGATSDTVFPASAIHDHDFRITTSNLDRYGCGLTLGRDFAISFNIKAQVWA